MRLIAISDTHCRIRKVKIPDGDLLVHSGDLTFRGDIQEISQELRALGAVAKKFKHGCIFISGNHDWLGERNPSLMKQMAIDEGLIYLDHSSIQIEGINIFGSAYTPEFCNWAYNVPRGPALAQKWAQIPDDTNILVTHGPPMEIMDIVNRYDPFNGWSIEHVGCEDLSNRIKELKDLKLHLFGHIHGSYGQIKIGDITYINASICTEEYKPFNAPISFEL